MVIKSRCFTDEQKKQNFGSTPLELQGVVEGGGGGSEQVATEGRELQQCSLWEGRL